jgi:hypothetical protein
MGLPFVIERATERRNFGRENDELLRHDEIRSTELGTN